MKFGHDYSWQLSIVGISSWWPSLGLSNWYPINQSNHSNSSRINQVSIKLYVSDLQMSCSDFARMKGYQDSSLSNSHWVTCPIHAKGCVSDLLSSHRCAVVPKHPIVAPGRGAIGHLRRWRFPVLGQGPTQWHSLTWVKIKSCNVDMPCECVTQRKLTENVINVLWKSWIHGWGY